VLILSKAKLLGTPAKSVSKASWSSCGSVVDSSRCRLRCLRIHSETAPTRSFPLVVVVVVVVVVVIIII
jgi:hypothetical protein